MQSLSSSLGWWKRQSILVKLISGLFVLILTCCLCSIPVALIAPDKTPTSEPVAQDDEPAPTSLPDDPASTSTPVPTPIPTDPPPAAELSFADIVQNPNEKSWSSTQYSTYFDTIKGQRITGWSGTILEVKEWGGEPYLSLDIEPSEPKIDVYAYINKADVLKVGLGQNVTIAGTIDSNWSEGNNFYALQLKDVTLLELGEIPPTPTVVLASIPTNTPLADTSTSASGPAQADGSPSPLGITQESLRGVYEDFGFTFKDATQVNGQPRIMGEAATASVELIGPPENLVQAGVMFAATEDQDQNTANLVYMIALLNGAVYEWDGAIDWLTTSFPRAIEQGSVSTTQQNKYIELSAFKDLGLIILTIKGIPQASAPAPDPGTPVVVSSNNINLRAGPGTDYDQVGTIQADQSLPLIGRNLDSSWWQVSTPTGPAWVNAGVVTALNVPVDLPVVTASGPSNTASSTAYTSGGLGLSQTDWEQSYPATGEDLPGFTRHGDYIVSFQQDNVSYIERQWDSANAITETDLKTEFTTLIPADSQLIQTYSPEGRPETIVNLYFSESLKDRFSPDLWIGGQPGNFTVQYNAYDYGIGRMIITLGNNP